MLFIDLYCIKNLKRAMKYFMTDHVTVTQIQIWSVLTIKTMTEGDYWPTVIVFCTKLHSFIEMNLFYTGHVFVSYNEHDSMYIPVEPDITVHDISKYNNLVHMNC